HRRRILLRAPDPSDAWACDLLITRHERATGALRSSTACWLPSTRRPEATAFPGFAKSHCLSRVLLVEWPRALDHQSRFLRRILPSLAFGSPRPRLEGFWRPLRRALRVGDHATTRACSVR